MTRAVRASTPADAGAIVALLTQAGLTPKTGPQELYWRYWLPRADWPGPRSYVVTDGSTPIAHGALVPGTWLSGSRRVRVVHVIDWAAQRSAIGAGAMLMKYIAQQADLLLAIGGTDETMRMLPNLGFRPAGSVRAYGRTLRPWRLLYGTGRRQRLRGLLRASREALRALAAPRNRGRGWSVRQLAAASLGEIAAALPSARPGIGIAERRLEQLAYALECPIAPMTVSRVDSPHGVRGYFLLASVPGQVRIGDCWVDSEAPQDWAAMLGCAVEQASRDPQAAEIIGWANDELTARAFRECGFRGGSELPMLLRSSSGAQPPAEPLRVQMLDSDAAYL
jgi:hypothetical protein